MSRETIVGMNDARLQCLLAEFCTECGFDATEALLDSDGFVMHGVRFYLYRNQAWPDFLSLYCEFGALPAALSAQACRALLEANLLLAHQGAMQQSFTLDPDSEVVLASAHQLIAELDVARLRQWLVDLAEQAMAWREDYFLAPDNPAPTTAPPHWLARQGTRR